MDTQLLAQINPNESIAVVRGLLIGLASLALIFVGVSALFGPGRTGNSKGVATRLMASLLALVPIAIGIGIGASAFGVDVLDWLVPSIGA